MGNCWLSICFSIEVLKDKELVEEYSKDLKFVCRDDLKKKPLYSIKEGSSPATNHGKEEGSRKQVIGSSGGVTRVKILLTEKEASLLLSKCKVEEGLLKLKLSDHQLQRIKRINTSRTENFPTSLDRRSWNPALESISEEF